MTNHGLRDGRHAVIVGMEKTDRKTAAWLLETCRQHGIDPARGIQYLVTHFRERVLKTGPGGVLVCSVG